MSLKPKLEKIKNMTSGNTTVLFNKEKYRNFKHRDELGDVDLDLEELKLKVCMRKEIDYDKIGLVEDMKGKDNRRYFNEKKRSKLVEYIKEKQSNVVNILKHNSKILHNWISYIGFLSKMEFFSALVSIGVPNDVKLLEEIFWIFDFNGDQIVDSKEFAAGSSLFKGYTVEDRIKSRIVKAD